MIKIGIDPSGTGTTAIVVYKNNKLIDKQEFTNKGWKEHYEFIINYLKNEKLFGKILSNNHKLEYLIFIENCLYTNANGSKDRDDLLKLLGSLETQGYIATISPKHTKSVVKNMENLSKYNDSCLWKFDKDINLTYEYGKGWKYNNEKISNHLRDAIIIANYES
ncbi:hypothetical protein SMH99_00670 [Spiroplasma poulsonii]|nr:hypothetical protein SMH99_00200 [Spiroplasma poulsonii]PWF97493.1 hypothetical protein SMH99_00420 [Spiroplasma poulsonii]PWF97518.1 hypothetical protein SMH99_00670 [Spiroplasma poulsonii]